MSLAMTLPSPHGTSYYLESSFSHVNPEIRFLTHDMAFGLSLLRASSKLHLTAKWIWWDRGTKECADILIVDYQHPNTIGLPHIHLPQQCFNCLVVEKASLVKIKPHNCHCLLSKSLGAAFILEKVLTEYNLKNF